MKESTIGTEALGRVADFMQEKTAQGNYESGYQGYKNYETWAVALEINNDQGLYEYFWENIAEMQENVDPDRYSPPPEDTTSYSNIEVDLADSMQSYYEEFMPELDGIFGTLLNSAFQEIDWREIAKDFLEE